MCIPSWEPVRSSTAAQNFFSNFATVLALSPLFRHPLAFHGSITEYRCSPTTSKSYCTLSAPRFSHPWIRALCSHFYGKRAVSLEISVGVEKIAYTAHWSSSVPSCTSIRLLRRTLTTSQTRPRLTLRISFTKGNISRKILDYHHDFHIKELLLSSSRLSCPKDGSLSYGPKTMEFKGRRKGEFSRKWIFPRSNSTLGRIREIGTC